MIAMKNHPKTYLFLVSIFSFLAMLPLLAKAEDSIQRGKYLATAGDCISCHTAPGGTPFAGGLKMKTPFGFLVTPNITPDKETGIGSWNKDDFLLKLGLVVENALKID
jgi:hypothetical protein